MARTGENIYKRQDGRWEGRCIYSYDESGKAKYKYVYAKSYSEVKKKLIQAQQVKHIALHDAASAPAMKYESLLNEWLSFKELRIKESSYIRYRNSIQNHILPQLGKYPIEKISTALIQNFVVYLSTSGKLNGTGGLSAKTVSDILVIVKESFRYAQAHGIPVKCAFDNIAIKRTPRKMRVLSCTETKRLVDVLTAEPDLCKLGVLISLFTGIRIGELCALQWKHISIADRTIKIEQTMQRLQQNNTDDLQKTRIIITDPKSFSSIRTIPLPEFVVDAIKPHQESADAYLLSGDPSRHIEPRIMQNKFKRYLSACGIEDANFHSLRHTFATRCVEAGFDVKTLSEILGHASVKITLDKYVHSSMVLKRMNMEKLKLV